MSPERAIVALTHPEKPCVVEVVLPADMGIVADVLMALGTLGFVIPEAVGAKHAVVKFDVPDPDAHTSKKEELLAEYERGYDHGYEDGRGH